MSRPTASLPGGPVVNIEVPPGWLTTITVVSRQPYNQLARLRYTTRGVTNTQYFANQSGKSNVIMEDLITGNKTFALAGQSGSTTVSFAFFHSKDPKVGGRNLEDKNYYSSQLFLVPVTKPKKAPAGTPDYVTYFILVEDTNQSANKANASSNYDDIVATVNVVEGDVPPAPDKAVFERAGQAIGDFQFSTGIPDEDLGPPPPYIPPPDLSKLPVGILGAGAAGMYTAMILDSLGINYEILEASGRHGGRLYTYNFPKVTGPYQYFDAGAMRYPDIDFMKRTFELARDRLNLKDKLIEVIMSNPNTFVHFNGIRATKQQYSANWAQGATAVDTFRIAKTSSNPDGYIPEEYIKKGHKKLYDDAIKPLKELFATSSFQDAYKKLLDYDKYSVKSYFSFHMGYPDSVIRWIETMEWRTGMFDAGLLDTVLADLAFDDPRNRAEGKDTKWYCFDGGSRVLADAMLDKVQIKPKYYQRVTAIRDASENSNEAIVVAVDGRDDPRLANNYTADKKYSNVICTLPLSVLRTVDLDRVHLSANQRNGLRELLYSPSVKIGIQFKTAWWEKLGIIGGQTYTDRPARAVVYPSHGPGLPGSKRSNVLIASYNGMQDSQRLGALMKGRDTSEEKMLLNLIMNDLSVIHGVPVGEIWEQFIDYYPWDWYSSSLSLGAFGWFGPGQFKDIYPHLTLPASVKQRLFFAGEALSASHGWVAGALNSAWRCVYSMLKSHPELNPNPKEDIIQKFMSIWGDTEEWDNKVLEKHVYIGRELTKRQMAENDNSGLPPYKTNP